jgi:hypothetical protein
LTYAPTAFYHCQHCEIAFGQVGLGERIRRQEARDALPDDLRHEFQELSDWIHHLTGRFGGRIHVDVVDAASIEGVLKSLRHRVARYPAVIVAGERPRVGAEFQALESAIESKVKERAGNTDAETEGHHTGRLE